MNLIVGIWSLVYNIYNNKSKISTRPFSKRLQVMQDITQTLTQIYSPPPLIIYFA